MKFNSAKSAEEANEKYLAHHRKAHEHYDHAQNKSDDLSPKEYRSAFSKGDVEASKAHRYDRAASYLEARARKYGEGHNMQAHGEGKPHGDKA